MFKRNQGLTKFQTILTISLSALLSIGTAQAEFFGFANGRQADINSSSPISVEMGMVSGEFSGADYQNIGLRANYLLRDGIGLYADLSNVNVGRSDSTAYGVGAYYSLGKFFEFADTVALKGSLHSINLSRFKSGDFSAGCTGPVTVIDPITLDLELDPGTCGTSGSVGSNSTVNIRAISVELLFSGNPIKGISTSSGPAVWYANIGYHNFNDNKIDSKVGFGAGLVLPWSKGELYGGIDFIDEPSLGIGYRYFVN